MGTEAWPLVAASDVEEVEGGGLLQGESVPVAVGQEEGMPEAVEEDHQPTQLAQSTEGVAAESLAGAGEVEVVLSD